MSQHAVRLRAPTVGAIVLATVAVLALVAGCASSSPRATSPSGSSPGRVVVGSGVPTRTATVPAQATKTVNHVFAGWGSNGAPAAGVVAHRSGSCFTASILVSAAGAYRCFAGNQLLDPCFASAAAKTLMCYGSPWSKATELALTATLPATAPFNFDRPWAIELDGGQRCVAVSGTMSTAQGVSLGYQCASGAAGLRGTSGQPLQALYRASSGALRPVAVVATWKA